MVTVRSILNKARESKRWSIARLHRESGVKTHPTNLRRKLVVAKPDCQRSRPVALDPIEVDQLAKALGVSVPPSVFSNDLLAGRIARCRSAHEGKRAA